MTLKVTMFVWMLFVCDSVDNNNENRAYMYIVWKLCVNGVMHPYRNRIRAKNINRTLMCHLTMPSLMVVDQHHNLYF